MATRCGLKAGVRVIAGCGDTAASFLAGTNSNSNSDISGRKFQNDVNTGWLAANATTASDILMLWGMGTVLGSAQTDTFVLSLGYDKTKGSSFLLATPDGNGQWINAVVQNTGGASRQVSGPWKPAYGLGTYGIDTATQTVWAVLNFNGAFAAIAGA